MNTLINEHTKQTTIRRRKVIEISGAELIEALVFKGTLDATMKHEMSIELQTGEYPEDKTEFNVGDHDATFRIEGSHADTDVEDIGPG